MEVEETATATAVAGDSANSSKPNNIFEAPEINLNDVEDELLYPRKGKYLAKY